MSETKELNEGDRVIFISRLSPEIEPDYHAGGYSGCGATIIEKLDAQRGLPVCYQIKFDDGVEIGVGEEELTLV